MKQIINNVYEASQYLKEGYVLIVIENKTIIHFKNEQFYLMNENWHSKLNESDFISTFFDNTFFVYEVQEEDDSSNQKDEEYYQWRSKYL